jgi:hypothetical protein
LSSSLLLPLSTAVFFIFELFPLPSQPTNKSKKLSINL